MIDHFYTDHCRRGELYIEFLKGTCEEAVASFARNGVDHELAMSQGHIPIMTKKGSTTCMLAKRHSLKQKEKHARLMITNSEHKFISYIMAKR